MKKLMIIPFVFLLMCSGTYARKFVAEGKTWSTLGDYKIELADKNLSLNGEELKTFVITYANSPMEVTIAVQQLKKEKRYLVLSNALSVQYVCHGDYFGVELLDNTYAKDGMKTSPSALNRTEYFHQKALTTGEGCELDHTRLIAAFFPVLINNYENILATR